LRSRAVLALLFVVVFMVYGMRYSFSMLLRTS